MTDHLRLLDAPKTNLTWRSASPRRSRHGDCSPAAAIAFLLAFPSVIAALCISLLPGWPVLPTLSLAALMLAATAAAFALSLRIDRRLPEVTLWDAAGTLALLGFGAGMLSDAESILQLFFGERARE